MSPILPDQIKNSPTANSVANQMDTNGPVAPGASGVVTRFEAQQWMEKNFDDPRVKQILSEALSKPQGAITQASIGELFGLGTRQTHALEEISRRYDGFAKDIINHIGSGDVLKDFGRNARQVIQDIGQ
jgi:hypothetical protein